MIRVKADPLAHRVYFGIDNIKTTHKRAIRNAMFDIGLKNRSDIRNNMKRSSPKTGRIYTINGRVHQSSAPGEAPANFTGKLARSVGYTVRGYSEVTFGYGEEYGLYLEKGTEKDGSVHIKPRTNLKKVMDDNAQTFINYMVRSFNANK